MPAPIPARVLVVMLAVPLAACDGSTTRPRSGVDAGASRDAAPADGASQAPPEVTPAVDTAFEVPPPKPQPTFPPPPAAQPLPSGVAPPRRLLGPDDRLAGGGANACSTPYVTAPGAPPAPARDRWCVFYRTIRAPEPTPPPPPGTVSPPPVTELWVVNASKALAGTTPRCDGTSPDCVRLTNTLWTGLPLGGPGHPYSHAFDGETLIYYASSKSSGQMIHEGPVSAWRPGWTAPRVLTSDKGVMCFGHPRRPLVHCMDALAGDPMHPDSFELRVGSVAEPPPAPLPSLGRVRPFDSKGQVAWQAMFSPDGETFAVSSPDPDPAVETLRIVPTADLLKPGAATTSAPKPILSGMNLWVIGNDSRRVYFQRVDPAPTGTPPDNETRGLFAADFPSGAGEVRLGSAVRDYILLGEVGKKDEGVAFLSQPSRDRTAFRFVRDTRMPSVVTVFSYRDLLEGVRMSPDFRYTAWLDGGFNARVVRHGDLNVCRLNVYVGGAAFDPQFLAGSGLVFWNEDTPLGDRRDAFLGRPDDCGGTARFATAIAYYEAIGDRGLVYTDEKDDAQRATLKYAVARKSEGGTWELAPPVKVHEHLEEGYFTILPGDPSLILFRTHGANEPEPGTYVFGPLPL